VQGADTKALAKNLLSQMRNPPRPGKDFQDPVAQLSIERDLHTVRDGPQVSIRTASYLDLLCARRFLRMRFFFHFHRIRPFFLNFLGRLPMATPVRSISRKRYPGWGPSPGNPGGPDRDDEAGSDSSY
jgi:hypothetical protein